MSTELIYYVYAYMSNSGLPYYIGKGKDRRAYKNHGKLPLPKDKSKILFLETNLSEIGALALERRYIKWYGRIDQKTGILANTSDGGDGGGSNRIPWNKGKTNVYSKQTKEKMIENNPNTKLWKIKSPDGEEYIISSLNNFCTDKGLCFHGLFKSANHTQKHYKNWQCRYIDDETPFIDIKSYKKSYNRKSKYLWILTDMNGETYQTTKLKAFCKEKNISSGNIVRLYQNDIKSYKGWSVSRKEIVEEECI